MNLKTYWLKFAKLSKNDSLIIPTSGIDEGGERWDGREIVELKDKRYRILREHFDNSDIDSISESEIIQKVDRDRVIAKDYPNELINRALEVWSKAQVLYKGISWQYKPEALEIQEKMLTEPDLYHDLLIDILEHENQLVSAYAINTLLKMESDYLCNLPDELLNRKNKVTIHEGSFRTSSDLGGIAKGAKKIMLNLKNKGKTKQRH